ncbi:Glycoside hydrolase superfamily [Lactarius tabidus]
MRSLLQILALSILSLPLIVSGAPTPDGNSEAAAAKPQPIGPQGIDVSNHQGPNINWGAVRSGGVQFAYIKATESTTFIDPDFNRNYVGATNVGIIRGAYHFARPGESSGAAQAHFFLAHGGGWSSDGRTLPGAIDLEGDCSGLSHEQMVNWIRDFSNLYRGATGSWWISCTGNNGAFGANNPLWIARWGNSIGPLPAGWSFPTFWQYADSGPYPGDQDYFNGGGLQRYLSGFRPSIPIEPSAERACSNDTASHAAFKFLKYG